MWQQEEKLHFAFVGKTDAAVSMNRRQQNEIQSCERNN
jgi:hypothetical protein